MQKVLRKRILRDLRENKFRYLALAVPTVNTGLRMESFPYLCRSRLQNERS